MSVAISSARGLTSAGAPAHPKAPPRPALPAGAHQTALAAVSLLGVRAGECVIQTTPALTALLHAAG